MDGLFFQVKSDESKRHRLILNSFEHGLNQQMSGFAALPLLIALRSHMWLRLSPRRDPCVTMRVPEDWPVTVFQVDFQYIDLHC